MRGPLTARGYRRLLGLMTSAVIAATVALPTQMAHALASTLPSDSCSTPTLTAVDGYPWGTLFGGAYVKLRVQQASDQTFICYRVQSANPAVYEGGAIVVQSIAAPPPPTVDSNSAACTATPGNTAPGPHPLLSGAVGPEPFMLDTFNAPGTAWICFSLATIQVRVVINLPSASGTPSVTNNVDSPQSYMPNWWVPPTGYPSSTCSWPLSDVNYGGVNVFIGGTPPSLAPSDELCIRVQGATGIGGQIVLSGAPYFTGDLLNTSANPSACTISVFSLTSPTSVNLSISAPGSAMTICLGGAGIGFTAVEFGETVVVGSNQGISWTPDPDTPVPGFSI
jgi:hypothetical protein